MLRVKLQARGKWKWYAGNPVSAGMLCADCGVELGRITFHFPFNGVRFLALESGYKKVATGQWEPTRDALRRYRQTGKFQPRRYAREKRRADGGAHYDRDEREPGFLGTELPALVTCYNCSRRQEISLDIITESCEKVLEILRKAYGVDLPETQC